MKKLTAFILSALLLFSLFSGVSFAAHENKEFSFESTGALNVTGVSYDSEAKEMTVGFENTDSSKQITEAEIYGNAIDLYSASSAQVTFSYELTENEKKTGNVVFDIKWREESAISLATVETSAPESTEGATVDTTEPAQDTTPEAAVTPAPQETQAPDNGDQGSQLKSALLTVRVGVMTVIPDISITRLVSATSGSAGRTIVLEYTITNHSDREISVQLYDPEIFEATEYRLLAAGETSDKIHKSIILEKDVTSEPYATYTDINGEMQRVYTEGRKVDISLEKPALELTISADKDRVNYGEGVTIHYSIRNTGNSDFKNIHIYDTFGNDLLQIESLKAGSSKISRSIDVRSITGDRSFQFTAKGESTGQTLSYASNRVTVGVNYSAADIRLNVSGKCDKESYQKGEEAFFTVTVQNNGGVAVQNVQVYLKGASDQQIGVIDQLGAGESKSVSYAAYVNESGAYNFEAKVLDQSGIERNFINTEPVNVTVAQPTTAAPAETPEPDESETPDKITTSSPNRLVNTVLYIVLALFILMLASGVTYFILRAKDNKARKTSRFK